MSENEEAIRRGYEAWNRRDFSAILELFDSEIEWVLPEGGLHGGSVRGHEQVRAFMESYFDAFNSVRMEPETFIEAADQVVVFLRVPARGRGSGVEVEVRPAHVWTMRDGKAIHVEVFPERDRALAAAGLPEDGEG